MGEIADRFGLDVKYGGGPPEVQKRLGELSGDGREIDTYRSEIHGQIARLETLSQRDDLVPSSADSAAIANVQAVMMTLRTINEHLRAAVESLVSDFRRIVREASDNGEE